jgi:hypothetical protein
MILHDEIKINQEVYYLNESTSSIYKLIVIDIVEDKMNRLFIYYCQNSDNTILYFKSKISYMRLLFLTYNEALFKLYDSYFEIYTKAN